MQLIYRGSSYSPIPFASSTDCDITGMYRGVEVAFKAPLGVAHPQAVATLKYRGNYYLRVRG